MVWMETYLLYCSVRLGVMVISVLSFIFLFISSIVFFVMGLKVLNPVLKLFNDNENFREYSMVNMVTDDVENDSTKLKVLLQVYFFAHMTASVLAFYGSLKLKKYFLLPMVFFELCRVVFYLAMHVLIMIAIKNSVDLGILITNTLLGGFLILFLGYNWTACVALYQIINLINSERYKAIYGDDPFKPLIPKTYNPMATAEVRVLITPTNYDIDEQKKRNAVLDTAAQQNRLAQPQAIISVLPVNYLENNSNTYRNNLKWKQSQWPTTTVKTPATAQIYPTYNDGGATQNNYELNYNNWQWSEIAPTLSERNN